MVLAAIFFVFFAFIAPTVSWGEINPLLQDAAQQSSGAQAPDSSTTQPSESKVSSSQAQTSTSAPQNPPPAQPPPSGATSHAHGSKHKKNVKTKGNATDCPAEVETAKQLGGDQAAAAGSEHEAAKNPSAAPSANCPPPKKVVPNGGTAEPTIRLVGGAKIGQGVDDHSTTEQLLGATEENLKKIAGRQLDTTQQETLNQINQFVEQSKAAVAAGDADRGHNLALKARLLSDELGKP
jgi:hypothetical protein